MKILLTGNYPAGMFVLSSIDGIIINMFNPPQDTEFKEIDRYLDMCLCKELKLCNIVTANVCNDSPWSDLLTKQRSDKLLEVKDKLYKHLGWKPDVIIYIYDDAPKQKYVTSQIMNGNMPVYSTNSKDKRFAQNLTSIVNEIIKVNNAI